MIVIECSKLSACQSQQFRLMASSLLTTTVEQVV
jgi:hypothetical protein